MAKGPPRKKALRTGPERNLLVEANMGLVRKLAGRFAGADRNLYDEYHSAGCMGLMRAAELWDSRHGTYFSTYAWRAISTAIIRYRRLADRAPDAIPLNGEDVAERPAPGSRLSPELLMQLEHALNRLPDVMQLVLRLRLGFGGVGEHTLREVASRICVSRERVRQIQQEAMALMADFLYDQKIDLF